MNIQKVHINAGGGYDVSVGRGLLDNCGQMLAPLLKSRRVAVVSDSNVAPLYLHKAADSLKKAGFEVSSTTFTAGEENKNMTTLAGILEFLASEQLTRDDCVIALGGGVVGDMTGFAAGCYLRGVRFVQLPTTLLAAVDSSVGGKTAVDLAAGKNLSGVFIQPKAVILDTDCLDTLSDHFFADGLAEAVKTAILSGEGLFEMFENGSVRDNLQHIITECVRYKGYVVEQDEFEGGLRQLLNLGHTIGHAVEKCSGYQLSHGHAVAIGTAMICRAAARMGLCDESLAKRVEAVIEKCSLPVTTEYTPEELTKAALVDKKRRGDSITLVIPKAIGDCVLHRINIRELQGIIEKGWERLA